MSDSLPLPLVVGGALPGWTVRVNEEWRARREWSDEDALLIEAVTDDGHPDHWDVSGYSRTHGCRSAGHVPSSALSLVLPGPLGCNAHGLTQRVKERIGKGCGGMPAWFYEAAGHAAFDDVGSQWLSRYLVMTDALAAARGWPTGPGAPVYGWEWSGQARRWLLSGDGYKGTYALTHDYGDERAPATLGITDPMEALEATWKREATHE